MSANKVMVGLSGGVDSSVSAYLLMKSGFETAGVTLTLCGDGEKNSADALSVCKRMGISHYSFDLREDFKNYVIADFNDKYISGKTPNPCLCCNKHIKFGKMAEIAESLGYDKIATGHYAVIKRDVSGRFLLYRAKDISKDQSYVLYMLNQTQLSRTLFPLGEYTKSEVREIARKNGFVNADRADSQDICFVPDGDYAAFIGKSANYRPIPGDYVDTDGNLLGRHKGIIHYTLGQRKGLGIALGKPAFVIDKNPETNKVVLGDEERLFKTEVTVCDTNFIPFDTLNGEMRVTAKLRYRHTDQPATILPIPGGDVKIIFDEPQRAPSPGQAAVFYSGDLVVGGGTIV